jgi:tetratricopeptide (TPR) repeat protein
MAFLACARAFGQEAPPPVERYVAMVESGDADPVRLELPSLLATYPNDPGVLYLQALLTREGAEAVRHYQNIVDNHPKSAWADDALYKVYQFYNAIGLYRTAELKLNQLKREYPNSPLVTGKTEVDTRALPEERVRTTADPAAGKPATGSGQFTLQVGAYSTQVNANKQKLFFEDLGYPVEVVSKVKDGRSLWSVNVGSFATYDEAKAKSGEIKRKYNVDSFVVTR